MKQAITIQVTSVWPGSIGGAIFKGSVIGTNQIITCKAFYKVMLRTPLKGEFWEIEGYVHIHAKYGEQFQVHNCNLAALPENKYLSSLLVRHPSFRGFHFGKSKVKRLIDQVGHDSLIDLLNSGSHQVLADILNPDIAKKLVDAWSQLQNEVDTASFLKEYKFDPSLSKKIIRFCRRNTAQRLKQNPYALICFGGITPNIWRLIESAATKLKIPLDDSKRLVGAIEHILYERLRDGHTATELESAKSLVASLLKNKELAEQSVGASLNSRATCITTLLGSEYIQPIGPALIEYSIECILRTLVNNNFQQSLFTPNEQQLEHMLKSYTNDFSNEIGFTLNHAQINAIRVALTNRCSVISGCDGTGKTTVLRAVTDLALSTNRQVHLMALAATAKERLSTATGRRAMTIHDFINTAKNDTGRINLDCDPLIIIDEAPMVDAALFNKLLSLFNDRPFSLLTVGDTAQLSPIGFGVIWHKLANSSLIPMTQLSNVHRQHKESPINRVAMNIRNNDTHSLETWKGQEEGIYIVPATDRKLLLKLRDIKRQIPRAQILTPHMSKATPDSGHIINEDLQHYLNPELVNSKQIRFGTNVLRIGDPVIVTENNYEINLFNGTIGSVTDIYNNSQGEKIGLFIFNNSDCPIELTTNQMFDIGLRLAYAISIHKSQDSEYNSVAVCCVSKSQLLERSSIYTSVSRAKNLCLIVGSQDIYNASIKKPLRSETLNVGFMI